MDSDDAVDLLEDIDDELKEKIRPILDEDVKADIQLIHSYEEDEIGSLITTNYISISNDLSIKQATEELIRQAGENDNISTIYVTDEQGKFCGAGWFDSRGRFKGNNKGKYEEKTSLVDCTSFFRNGCIDCGRCI